MVRALLDGRKTQTRRVIRAAEGADFHRVSPDGLRHFFGFDEVREGGQCGVQLPCLPFAPGDRLWVKETWRTLQKWDDMKPRHVMDDVDNIDYAASGFRRNPLWAWGKTRVSIFMPRWASRITLRVTDVRVERLQDCSEADALAEGVELLHTGSSPVVAYSTLWNLINGPGAWEANPWVVAVTFSVVRGNIDQVGERR